MIEIIAGTDRPNSNTLKVARFVHSLYADAKVPAEILDLSTLNLSEVSGGPYGKVTAGGFREAIDRVNQADGLVMVVPEYNGSYPGILKLFIDYWKYPDTFEGRPVAFIGLGTRWGGLRPVEHLQQVFTYRAAYNFPVRVFLSNIDKVLQDGKIIEPMMLELIKTQTRDFPRFIEALRSQSLDAKSRPKK